MQKENVLGTGNIGRLMVKFAVPSIIAMLVSALYNIVDQFFIGQAVGMLGNAATNVAFPLTTSCVSLALLFGIGGASSFNLAMGRKERDKAAYFVGNSAAMLVISGVLLLVITQLFLEPLLLFFGSDEEVLTYASPYVRITSIGFPFLILTTGGGHLIRADGSPKMTMICNITGAVINTILDAIFVLGLNWGMEGAAAATIIGQIISACIVIRYIMHYKTVKLASVHFRPQFYYVRKSAALGTASFFNQLAIMIVQIVMNNLMSYYGAMSEYGKSIPLSCSGVIIKVSQVLFAVIIGISQGTQPIESFNYGAQNYQRVKAAYKYAVLVGGALSVLSFTLYQVFPEEIISIFGKGGGELYFDFGVRFFRIYLFGTIVSFMQPITSTFFTSIGKAHKGIFLSLTRQILFLMPLMIILAKYMGIDGIMYAGPIADFLSLAVTIVMAWFEMRSINRLEKALKVPICATASTE